MSVLERETTIDEPGAYLRRVVVNNCHGLTRRSLVGRRKLTRLAALEARQLDQLPPEVDETWNSLDLLSPKQRTAVVLRFYADLPIAEIADLMGERPFRARALLSRAAVP